MTGFRRLFPTGKPVLGMLHLGGETAAERLTIALEEARILDEAGFDGVIVENYFGDIPDVEAVLKALGDERLRCRVGINILGNTEKAFALADRYRLDFIQVDSVSGHLLPDEDAAYGRRLNELRAGCDAVLLGGVRFKYMPVRSGRSEAEDLQIGMTRCDAIVVTSDATGQPTDMNKVRRFRDVLGPDKPLLIGAGLTPDNVSDRFSVADGGIVGSGLKDNHQDNGRISPRHVGIFLDSARGSTSGPTF
jgi:predicted TIM-barrel enzyme